MLIIFGAETYCCVELHSVKDLGQFILMWIGKVKKCFLLLPLILWLSFLLQRGRKEKFQWHSPHCAHCDTVCVSCRFPGKEQRHFIRWHYPAGSLLQEQVHKTNLSSWCCYGNGTHAHMKCKIGSFSTFSKAVFPVLILYHTIVHLRKRKDSPHCLCTVTLCVCLCTCVCVCAHSCSILKFISARRDGCSDRFRELTHKSAHLHWVSKKQQHKALIVLKI